MRANIFIVGANFRLRKEDGAPSLQSHLLRRNKELSRRYLSCHGCGTIVARLWHNSRTVVARSFHRRGTTYFFERVSYFLATIICFLATIIYFLALLPRLVAPLFVTSTQGASNKVAIFLLFFVVLTLIMRLIYKIMRRFAVQTCVHTHDARTQTFISFLSRIREFKNSLQ